MSVCSNISLDREEIARKLGTTDPSVKLWYNITVFDKRKLFRASSLLVNISVLDINDNAPTYPQPKRIDLQLDLNSMHATHESASIDAKHYFLILNRTATDPDAAENGSLNYFLHSVRSDQPRFASLPRFFVPTRTGQLWMSLEAFHARQHVSRSVYFYHVRIGVRDQRNRFDILDVHVRLNVSTCDEYKAAMPRRIDVIEERAFYFELDVEQAAETGQTRVGYLPIWLTNFNDDDLQPYEMNEEFARFFNLTIGRDGLVRVLVNTRFYENRARLTELDYLTSRFSFVTQRNEVRSIIVYFKFVAAASSQDINM